MKLVITLLLGANILSAHAQDTTSARTLPAQSINFRDTLPRLASAPKKDATFVSPYKTSRKEYWIIGSAVAVNLLGYQLINQKNDLTMAQLAEKTPDKLPFVDRWVAGRYSPKADRDSYILFNGSYVYPIAIMLLNKNEKKKLGQLLVLYVETVAITGAMYTLTAGLVYRSRPLVYGTKAPLEERLEKGAQRSFYGGHVAATAALSFFTAKVFQDFNPNSKAIPYIWAAAVAAPMVMSYERMIAGKHFLSDCILSTIIGGATGYLVPELHKNKKLKNLSLTPTMGLDHSGLALTYKF